MIDAMTTEQPSTQPNVQPSVQRVLRRRSDDRVLAGVASGLGDYFNVDPLLIRIAFVGLMVFDGLGLLLYLAAWLFIPTDTNDRSIVQRLLDRTGLTTRGILLGLLLVIGAFMFVRGLDSAADGSGFAAAVGAVIIVIVGAMILRRPERYEAAADPTVATPAQPGDPPANAVTAQAIPPRRVARPRPAPSPLGGYVLGAMLAAIGLLALAINISGGEVDLGQFFGLALGVIGIGLIIGTWWGHARWLILLGVLLLPFAISASFVTAPLEGGFGSQRFSPTTPQELQDEYRLVGGRMVLDLTDLQGGSEPTAVEASVAMGELRVLLPEDAGFELDASVGAGELTVLDVTQSGSRIEDRQVIEGDGPQFLLDLEAGVGEIHIQATPTEDR